MKGIPYPVEMAIGLNSNFNMTAPGTGQWDKALQEDSLLRSCLPLRQRDGSVCGSGVAFRPAFLEEWGYDHSPPGSGFAEVRIKQPVVKPRGDARPIADILFLLAGKLRGSGRRALFPARRKFRRVCQISDGFPSPLGGVSRERGLDGRNGSRTESTRRTSTPLRKSLSFRPETFGLSAPGRERRRGTKVASFPQYQRSQVLRGGVPNTR